jgi:isopenicillin N synthase-like dioxygenase
MEVAISEPLVNLSHIYTDTLELFLTQIMTNGIFKGPVHRVVTNSVKERISLAFFYSLDPEKEFGPIAQMLTDDQPTRYRNMKPKDLLVTHYENLNRGERVVNSLKI